MLKLLDHFIIAVPSILDEGNDAGGLKKYNAAYFIDKERDRFERKLRKGTILAVPIAFREINHMPIDPGLPTPRLFIGHDAIEQKINDGYRWSNAQYNPSATEGFDYVTVADYGRMITAKVGDEVYFHPRVTEDENYHGRDGDLLLYRAPVTDLICIEEMPQGGHIIVEPVAKQKEMDGILLNVDDEDVLLEGIVKFCRPGCGLELGSRVFFQHDSNWDFWIGADRYFAMLEENILLKETAPV